MIEDGAARQTTQTSTKQRHGCLTAYLVVMLIANFGVIISYLVIKNAPKVMPQVFLRYPIGPS